ncbi:MAG: potassium/proton antiporter [Eubacteriales bacterium]|nr:potassium/proton antiporter [Eubacteriales bacterium]
MDSITLLFISIVLISCLIADKLTKKIGLPSLFIFLCLGMIFGSDGLFKIDYSEYNFTDEICSVLLLFIMFTGGIGTNIRIPKKVLIPSALLSTIGVVITILVLGFSIHIIFNTSILSSFLLASAISPTDAATVFNILKNKKLNLKNNTSSILAIESGSNDPFSYLFTIIFIALINATNVNIPLLFFKQIFFGILIACLCAQLSIYILNKYDFEDNTSGTIFLFALSIFCYSFTKRIDGNQYLAVYIFGIILGNSFIPRKNEIIRFFNNITNLSQMIIFFLLGLLVTPHTLINLLIPSIIIFFILTFFARPIAISAIMFPFKSSINQVSLISIAGLRGASSIVFAIIATVSINDANDNIFNIVFIIVIFSILLQGTLLPNFSKVLGMIDNHENVMKSFNDYADDNDINFVKLRLQKEHPWVGKMIKEISPPDSLIAMIIRENNNIRPSGSFYLEENDIIILAGTQFISKENLSFIEININKNHSFQGKEIKNINLDKDNLIIMIKRNKETIIPNGNTKIVIGDSVIMCKY